VDRALFVDDDFAPSAWAIGRLFDGLDKGASVAALWGMKPFVNGRCVAAQRHAIDLTVSNLYVLPGMWGDDMLLGAVAWETLVLNGDLNGDEGDLLSDGGVGLLHDRASYELDREANIAAIRKAGLL
jgi:hypothetical protein